MEKWNVDFSNLIIRFAQCRCPISPDEPAGGSKVRSRFYGKCYLYKERFGKDPISDMLVVLWEYSQVE